jgi:tetratricopeptide (TPR) repeat protein
MRYIVIIILAFILMGASLEDARKANEAYEAGNYEEAIALYKKAIDDDPENAKLYYNLASAQAKAGNSQEAVRTFEQFKNMTDDEERRAMANYDIGNILAEQKQWDKAVEYYKKSLRYLSDDEDAKHNYELALKQQQNQQQQNQNQDQQQNQQNENDQQQDQNQQQKNNQQKRKKKSQQNQDQQGQQGEQEQDQNQQPQPRQSQMSQAEAEQILKALEQKEKELMKEFKKQKVESTDNKNEKDW